MKWFFRLIFSGCILLVPFSIIAQLNPTIPTWVNKIEIRKKATVNTNEVTDGFYFELIDEQYNAITRENYFHYAKRILNEEALTTVSQIEFSYDPSYEKGILHYIKVIRGDLEIDKTKNLEFKILNEENQRTIGILNGRKTFYTNLSDIRKGDIVEFCFSVNGENPIMGDHFNYSLPMGYSEPVGQIYFRLLFPKETILNTVTKNTFVKPVIKQASTFNDYAWHVINPPITKMESSFPSGYDRYPSVQISNLKNWEEVKQHCRSIFKLPAYDNAPLTAIIDSIVKIHPDPVAQLNSIIDFVQKHIRYSGNENGIYSTVPRTPDYVLKKRFGDCKEKSVLLNELLKLIHIEAYPVLINTTLGKKTPEHVPAILSFDHCISSFTFEGQLYFIDPIISYQAGSFKKRSLPSYETGMILDDKKNTFTNIPLDLSGKTKIVEAFENSDSTDTRLTITSTYTGANADDIRYYFHTSSLYEIQDAYKKFYEKYCREIQILDTIVFTDKEEKNEIVTVENYLLKKFWVPDDSISSIKIAKDFMPYALNDKLVYGEEQKRKDFLKINYPFNYTQVISVKHSNGWNIKEELIEERNKFFDYSYSKKVNGNTLELVYTYITHSGIIAPADYLFYKSKMEFVNHNMVLSIQETPYKKENVGFNWLMLATIILGLALASILIWYLNKQPYKSRFENKYPSIGGWLGLIGIGAMITPLVYLLDIYKKWDSQKDINYYYYFFHEESDFFSPLKGYYALFTTISAVMMLVYAVFLVTIFFQKRASFRFHYVLFKLISMLFLTLDVIVIYQTYSDSSSLEDRRLLTRQTASLVSLFINACIWIPYIQLSERSRHTFTQETSDEEETEYENYQEQF